jgi:hypothetical protein
MDVFSIVPIEVFTDERLSKTDLRVLGAVLSFRNKDTNLCWPKREQIAERCGLPLCKISTATTHLVDLGWLEKSGDGGRSRSTQYKLLIPNLATKTITESVTVTKSETVTDSETKTVTDLVTKTVTKLVRGIKQTSEQTIEQTNKEYVDQSAAPEKAKKQAAKKEFQDEFNSAFSIYPKRQGDNPKEKAFKAWKARLKDGVTIEEMTSGVIRYLAYCQANGNIGTQFVKQAATFFGPDKAFLEPWEVIQKSPNSASSRNSGYGKQPMQRPDYGEYEPSDSKFNKTKVIQGERVS